MGHNDDVLCGPAKQFLIFSTAEEDTGPRRILAGSGLKHLVPKRYQVTKLLLSGRGLPLLEEDAVSSPAWRQWDQRKAAET